MAKNPSQPSLNDPFTDIDAQDPFADLDEIGVSDYGKAAAGGAVTMTGSLVRGAGELARKVVRSDSNPFDKAADWVGEKGKAIQASLSPGAKYAMRGSTPRGDITKGEFDLGENPSLSGYGLQLAQGVGQFVPLVAGAAAFKKAPVLGGTATAAAAGGGAALEQEQQRIEQMPDTELANVPRYMELVQTMEPAAARAQLAKESGRSAFDYTAPVSALSGPIAAAPLSAPIRQAVSRLPFGTRIATGTAVAGAGEGLQEVAEQAGQTYGANQATGEDRSLTEDSAASFTLGALAGGPVGGITGAVSGEWNRPIIDPNTDEEVRPPALTDQFDRQQQAAEQDRPTNRIPDLQQQLDRRGRLERFAKNTPRFADSILDDITLQGIPGVSVDRNGNESLEPAGAIRERIAGLKEKLGEIRSRRYGVEEIPVEEINIGEALGAPQFPTVRNLTGELETADRGPMRPYVGRQSNTFDNAPDGALPEPAPMLGRPAQQLPRPQPRLGYEPETAQTSETQPDTQTPVVDRQAGETENARELVPPAQGPQTGVEAQDTGVQPDAPGLRQDVTASSGRPFKTEKAAKAKITREKLKDYAPAFDQSVNGWVARPVENLQTNEPNQLPADDQAGQAPAQTEKPAQEPIQEAEVQSRGVGTDSTLDQFAKRYSGYSAEKRAELQTLMEDAIETRKINGGKTQDLVNQLAVARQIDAGQEPTIDAVYSNAVEGHPESNLYPLTRNLIPYYVRSSMDAERKLFAAQKLHAEAAGKLAKAEYASAQAKTAAQKKKARAEIVRLRDKEGIHRDAVDAMRTETLPELQRLYKQSVEAFGEPAEVTSNEPVPPIVPTQDSQGQTPDRQGLADDRGVGRSGETGDTRSEVDGGYVDDVRTVESQNGVEYGIKRHINGKSGKHQYYVATRGQGGKWAEQSAPYTSEENALKAASEAAAEEKRQSDADKNERAIADYMKSVNAKKQNIDLTATDGSSLGRFSGPVYGQFIVHKTPGTGRTGYSVTHIQSGLAAKSGISNPEARELAQRFNLSGATWDGKNEKAMAPFVSTLREVAQQHKNREPFGDVGRETHDNTVADVRESTEEAAANTDMTITEAREWLLRKINAALVDAPTEKARPDGDMVTFDVPGDGKFTVRRSQEGLESFRKNVERSAGFSEPAKKSRPKPKALGPVSATIKEFEQSNNPDDYANAMELRRLRGEDVSGMEKMLEAKRKAWDARKRDKDARSPVTARLSQLSRQRSPKTAPTGTDRTRIEANLRPISRMWKAGPPVDIVQSAAELPADVRDYMASKGDVDNIEGIFSNGRVYLVADNISSVDRAREVLFHEAYGHYGLRGLLGEDLNPILDQVYRTYADHDTMRRIVDDYGLDVSTDEGRREAADELIANLAEDEISPSIWNRIVAAVNKFLRAAGFRMQMTKSEVVAMVAESRRRVQDGGMPGGDGVRIGEPPRFSRATNTSAFRRWFGDSKVVDENGEPLVVYHGTQKGGFYEFLVIDDWFSSGHETASLGSWFSEKSEVADEFAIPRTGIRIPSESSPTVYPVYLSIKNPKKYADFQELKDEVRRHGSAKKLRRSLAGDGFDGIEIDKSTTDFHGERRDYIAFDPTQIKSAIGNNGSYDPENPDIRFSRRRPATSTFGVSDDPSLWDRFLYQIQDKFRPLKKIQEAIGPLPESQDAYLAETLYHGKARARMDKFHQDQLEPMLKEIGRAGLKIEDVDEYLYARHAQEANARLRITNAKRFLDDLAEARGGDPALAQAMQDIKDNGTRDDYLPLLESELTNAPSPAEQEVADQWDEFADKPSGMTDAEAQEILAAATNPALADIGARVDAITRQRVDDLEAGGLLTAEEADQWRNTYQHYVPLKREGFDDAMPKIGRGRSISGKESKVRGGSTRRAVDILANTVAQYESTILRAEKAEVGRALLELVRANPADGFWRVEPDRQQAQYDSDGNIVMYPDNREYDNQIKVKIKGAQYTIEFEETNPNAMRIAAAMKNLDNQTGPIVNALSRVNRVLSFVNTSASPEFMISNAIRDLQTAAYNLNDTEAKNLKLRILMDWPKALAGIRSATRGKGTSQWAQIYRDFEAQGGKTGWQESYGSITKRAEQLEKDINRLKSGTNPRALIHTLGNFIGDYNGIVENGIRLAAYKNAIDAGVTPAKAAQLAKELTVNFNRKGASGQVINSLYLFANAGIQGSARILGALKSPRVRRAAYATIGAAVGAAMLNRAAGDDDDGESHYDKIPDYIKERNLIIMDPDGSGDYTKIPLPWGYNVLWVLGDQIAAAIDAARGRNPEFKALPAAANVAGAIANAFNPIQSATLLQAISPTVLDPIAMIAENKTFAGTPLMPDLNKFDKTPPPDSQRYWSSVRPTSKWVADTLNSLTGGDKIESGLIDISPETLDLYYDTITGSAGRFVADSLGTPYKAVTGQKVETKEVPMLRRVRGDKPQHADRELYYDRLSEVLTAKEQLKEYSKDPGKLAALRRDKAGLLKLQTMAKSTEKQLRALGKRKKAATSEAEKKAVEQRMEAIYRRFNARYRSVVLEAQ